MPPMKSPAMTYGLSSENTVSMPRVDEPAGVLVEEDQRREPGRADRVPLRHCLRGVADRVERIGHAAHGLGHVRHLGDPAGVVRHGPVRIQGHDQAAHRELGHHGDADPVDAAAGYLVGGDDAAGNHDHRQSRRLHACCQAGDDVRRVAGGDASAIFLTGFQRLPV